MEGCWIRFRGVGSPYSSLFHHGGYSILDLIDFCLSEHIDLTNIVDESPETVFSLPSGYLFGGAISRAVVTQGVAIVSLGHAFPEHRPWPF